MNDRDFIWRDGERTIRFGDGTLPVADQLLADQGWSEYELLSTERALAEGPPALGEGAAQTHLVEPGPVNETSAVLFEAVGNDRLVAFGGGRVLDTAKAIAAVRGGEVAAIPTTLSGAEMTAIHRLPEGRQAKHGRLRPALVIADPAAMTGLAEQPLRASAMNALAHGADSLFTPYVNPVATETALRSARLIADSLDAGPERDRGELALGALLSAYALDSQGLSLHHVVCQTLVRTLAIAHAETNATMLPRTLAALRGRDPEAAAALAAALGTEVGRLEGRIESLGGGPRTLSELGADKSRIDAAIETMLARTELATLSDPPGAEELRALVESAW